MKNNTVWTSKYFCGNEISPYGLEHHRIDYATLAKAFDAVLNNNIMSVTGWENWEQENGFVDNSEEIEELREKIDELTDEITDETTEEQDNEITDRIKEIEEQIEELEEERRILYVAITRAKTNCYLSYAAQRLKGDENNKRNVSPFLNEIYDCVFICE